MVKSEEAEEYLQDLKESRIENQLLVEFISKDLWSASVPVIDNEVVELQMRIRVLKAMKRTIEKKG